MYAAMMLLATTKSAAPHVFERILHSSKNTDYKEVKARLLTETEAHFELDALNPTTEAFYARGRGTPHTNTPKRHTPNHAKHCTHCGKTRHTKEECFDLHPELLRKAQQRREAERKAEARKEAERKSSQKKAEEKVEVSTKVKGMGVQEVFMATSTPSGKSSWYIDSACTSHICHNRDMFIKLEHASGTIRTAGTGQTQISGVGTVVLDVDVDGVKEQLHLGGVVYAPDVPQNLLSVGAAHTKGAAIYTDKDRLVLYNTNKENKTLCYGHKNKANCFEVKLWVNDPNYIEVDSALLAEEKPSDSVDKRTPNSNADVWHNRLGHISYERMRALADGKALGIKKLAPENRNPCLACARGKLSRAGINKNPAPRASKKLELVHVDYGGPCQPSIGGSTGFTLIVDDKTRFKWIIIQSRKSDFSDKFKRWKSVTETSSEAKLVALRSDNGGEFNSKEFTTWCQEQGIRHEHTAPHTPSQNGVAERAMRTIVSMARCMLQKAGLPIKYWAEAMVHAVHLSNRVPSKATNTTPFEEWTGRKPDLSRLRVFGCPAEVIVEEHTTKFSPRTKPVIYLGPVPNGKGDRFWDETTQKVIKSRNASHFENKLKDVCEVGFLPTQFTNKNERVVDVYVGGIKDEDEEDEVPLARSSAPSAPPSAPSASPPIKQEPVAIQVAGVVSPPQPQVSPTRSLPLQVTLSDGEDGDEGGVAPAIPTPQGGAEADQVGPSVRRSTRTRSKPIEFWKETGHKALLADFECFLADSPEPKNFADAMASSEKQKWHDAMVEELSALNKNKTFELVDLPQGKHAIGALWVYKRKLDSEGKIAQYKARLVARGCSQKRGLDYEETFAPVAKMMSIRIILAVAASECFNVHQLDVNNAYLNGKIDIEIYMRQPPGFKDKDRPDAVLRLSKSLYGLKQAGRIWYEVVRGYLVESMFNQTTADPCVFIRSSKDSKLIIGLYVDDFIIVGKLPDISVFKKEISAKFSIKDLGEAKHLVGLQVIQSELGIYLTQSTYLRQTLDLFGLTDCNSVVVPILGGEDHQNGPTSADALCDARVYRGIVGKLMYAMVGTRPDIAYAVGVLGRFASAPLEKHMAMAKRALRYVAGTRDASLFFPAGDGSIHLEGYTDSDWGGDKETRRSTGGYVFMVNETPVSWSSKAQQTVALSSTEAEYMAATQATKEAIWLRRLLADLGYRQEGPSPLHEDNRGAIGLAKNPIHHQRTKHIDIQHHFVRERVEAGDVELVACATANQVADIFTKALPREPFERHADRLLEF